MSGKDSDETLRRRNALDEAAAARERPRVRPEARSPHAPTDDGGVFDNEGRESGEHDRMGGAGLPTNQAGGRDAGAADGNSGEGFAEETDDREREAYDTSGVSSGARMPGDVRGRTRLTPAGTAGQGSG